MYTKASEASTAFGELRSYLFSVVNRGVNKGGLFCLKSLVTKEYFLINSNSNAIMA